MRDDLLYWLCPVWLGCYITYNRASSNTYTNTILSLKKQDQSLTMIFNFRLRAYLAIFEVFSNLIKLNLCLNHYFNSSTNHQFIIKRNKITPSPHTQHSAKGGFKNILNFLNTTPLKLKSKPHSKHDSSSKIIKTTKIISSSPKQYSTNLRS